MKMFVLIFLILWYNQSFAIQNGVIPKNLEVKIDKVLNDKFKGTIGTKEKMLFSAEIKREAQFNNQDDLLFKIKDLESNTIGFAYIGKEKSKTAMFDYLVLFDKNLIISQVKVLIYREDHGGEIGSVRWLKQFIGIDKSKTILYKKDIAGISGATISAASLTLAVNNVLKTVNKLHQLKLIQ